MEKFDLIIIGSGPGGYVASIRAAQRGMKVACIEKEKTLGGTCLNVGCIPSKALLHSTEYYHKVKTEGQEHGIEATNLSINLDQMMKRKKKIVSGLVQGIEFLFKKNQITRISGQATLSSPTTVTVGDRQVEAPHILLATGSEPIALPFLPFDEKRVLSSTGALSLTTIPKKLLIVGAGVIGLELGSVYRRMGTEIEVIELMDRVTPPFDRDISKHLHTIFSKQKMTFHLNRKVVSAVTNEQGVELTLDSQEKLQAESVLVAIGRKPYSEGLGLDKVGVVADQYGRVTVNHTFCTSVPSIYAIGDLIDGPMLAHKASEEGVAAVDLICGDSVQLNYMAIPNVMYTWPEVACVGLTEEEATQAGLQLNIGKALFKSIPRARCSGDEEGIVKIIGDKQTDRLIGLHILGPNASEMIHEGTIAIEKRATLREIAHASHAHPTCAEAIKEAALAAHGQAIHF